MTESITKSITKPIKSQIDSAKWPALALWTIALLTVSGCSSSSSFSKLVVGPITFTDANGTAQSWLKSITAGQSVYVDVTLTNDPQLLGADWSVYCGSALPPGTPLPPGQPQDQSCGMFTPAHTMSGPVPSYVTSGTGYVALYTAPATPPKEGTVTLYAAATSDHSRWATVTLTVQGLPISVGFAPAPPTTLEAGASAQIRAVLNNDTTNAGVDWSVLCASGNCGSFSPKQTTSGVATTYTAPATVPTGGVIKLTATSVADPTKTFSSTISIIAAADNAVARAVTGTVRAGQQPVEGAQVSLYAAVTSEVARQMAAQDGDISAELTDFTDEQGNFSIPSDYQCPTPDTQMYLVATSGNAGGGNNPDLVLMTALGQCRNLGSSGVIVNEVTTVALVYALNGFITDAQHIGRQQILSGKTLPRETSSAALAAAFVTAVNLVDITTGVARLRTLSGEGSVPQTKINLLANLLDACARTAGSAPGDGSPCDQLFQATNSKVASKTDERNTVQALLWLVRNPDGISDQPESLTALYRLAISNDAFGPTPLSAPKDWTLAIQFPPASAGRENVESLLDKARSFIDEAGNLWITTNSRTVIERVGGASCARVPKASPPFAFDSGNAP